MIARALVIAAALAGGTALLGLQAQTPPAPQTFRTATDVVFVDVSVRDGSRAVTGLRAEDFQVKDNGVRQRIDSVEATAVPIDLTLVVDLSGNPRAPWTGRANVPTIAAQLQAEVEKARQLLRPGDRLRLLAVDRRMQQVFAMQPASSPFAIARLEVGGLASLFDTLAAALLQPVEPARRHVVVARTKGFDTFSSIDVQALGAIAERSDALFHVVAMETALDYDAALSAFQCQMMGFCFPTRTFWVPFTRRLVGPSPEHSLLPDGLVLAAAAEATGGGLHRTAMFSEPSLTGTFRKAFDDFRSSYMLRYTLQGVPGGGWHTIGVDVRGSRSFTVRARKGYMVEESRPVPAPPPVLATPRTLAELTSAYDRDGYRQVAAGVRQTADPVRLLREFTDRGNPWPAAPRREAAFALELVEPAVFSPRPDARAAAYELLTRFSRLVRDPLEPSPFEQYWYFAALTLLEGAIRPDETDALATRALARFPGEPRFALSRAIAIDQRRVTRAQPAVVDAAGIPTEAHADAVRRAYTAAIAAPQTSVEAHIRLAWFLHSMAKDDEALPHLTQAGDQTTNDPSLMYLRQLFLGHVLWALDRQDDSIQAYRAALKLAPSAQSARVALMSALLMRGDRAGAEALSEQVQTSVDDLIDPWWMYWQGQYRFHSAAMTRLREMSR